MAGVSDRIKILQGDIVGQKVDAIVNAANASLLGGGGVDGAIHYAAGPRLLAECRTLGGCPTGEAKITAGYNLPAKWVIHTVGPIWSGGEHDEDAVLASCYRNSLQIARHRHLQTVAFPSISTGTFSFPLDRASRVAIREIRDFLEQYELPAKVTMVCFDPRTLASYRAAFAEAVS